MRLKTGQHTSQTGSFSDLNCDRYRSVSSIQVEIFLCEGCGEKRKDYPGERKYRVGGKRKNYPGERKYRGTLGDKHIA